MLHRGRGAGQLLGTRDRVGEASGDQAEVAGCEAQGVTWLFSVVTGPYVTSLHHWICSLAGLLWQIPPGGGVPQEVLKSGNDSGIYKRDMGQS